MAIATVEPRSERGKRRYAGKVVEAIDEIRVPGNESKRRGELEGAWCYFGRTDGATIRDALILSPNGAGEGRFGANAAHFREKARAKGRVYLGPRLTAEGVQWLVDTIAKNRDDEILFVEDEIAEQDIILANAESQTERAIAHKRKRQYQVRLETLNRPFDPDAMLDELNEIARAQRLAKIDPNVLSVMKEMVGEVNAKTAAMVARFQNGSSNPTESDPDLGVAPAIKNKGGRPRKITAEAVNSEFFDVG